MLEKSTLSSVLNDWSYWDKSPAPSIPRKILAALPSLSNDLVFIIQGVRRCGKSTLLSQIMTSQGMNPKHCFFVNFEDPRLVGELDYQLLDQVKEFAENTEPSASTRYFFFDEIQNVSNWEKWLNKEISRPSNNIYIITGSNAALLSGEVATVLTGRHYTIELFPFDYEEYKSSLPEGSFEQFLVSGGFPRVLYFDQPEQLLREYFRDIIDRDVRHHVTVRSSMTLLQTAQMALDSMGSELSQRKVAAALGIAVDTAGSYLTACEDAYLILTCPYFAFSEKKRVVRNKKYYPIDLGLRKAVIAHSASDLGKGLEMQVYLHLRKQNKKVFYWRGKGEVDFVTLDGKTITPYQVTWEERQKRHISALEEFYKDYPQALPVVFITRNNVESFLKM